MQISDAKLLDLMLQVNERLSLSSVDTEEMLYWCMSQMLERFKCTDAMIYIVDKDKKNGYTIVNGKEARLKNIPFTVLAKPELAFYFDPSVKSVLKPLEGFERGVYGFEEFVKVLVQVGQDPCFIFCELEKPAKEDVERMLKLLRLLSCALRTQIEKTEIFKLLYGSLMGSAQAEEERNQTLTELAGSVAHLLNQPLTSLMGYIELLIRKGEFKEGDMTYLNKIYNEAERLADIIRKIESVNSYVTEDYLGSAKIVKVDEASESAKGISRTKEKKVSKKLKIFLEFYKGVSQSKTKGEITHHYAFSLNKMFPNLKLLLLNYKKHTGEFFLEYKDKGGYSSDFELSQEKVEFYKKILGEAIKIFRFDEKVPHIITFPLVIDNERIGIAEHDFEREDMSVFDMILLESMTEELVISLHRLKLAEKNRYLKDYLSNLIENTSSLIFVLDENHLIRTCNPAFEDMMGSPKTDFEGKKFLDFVEEEQREKTLRSIEDSFEGKVIKRADLRLKTKEGVKVDTMFTLIPLPKVKNLKPEVIAIGQNITEVKKLEEQVMQSEKLAYLGQMAACIAHELNNPLTSIAVFTEYLHKKIKSDYPDKYDEIFKSKLEQIDYSAQRMSSFSRNLTSFAQPTTDMLPERINVNNIIRESVLFSSYEIDKDRVEIACRLDEALPEIEGHKGQLQQVFINLIGNAYHALNDSKGRISIYTRDHDEDFIRVEVTDNGEGIEEAVIDRIFEPFFSTRRGHGGTGLGLTIVKKIIDNHRGTIEVKSSQGKGTSFIMLLPK